MGIASNASCESRELGELLGQVLGKKRPAAWNLGNFEQMLGRITRLVVREARNRGKLEIFEARGE